MPSIPISKTKIIPPSRRPQLLTRKRLLDLMYEALDKKLTLVTAQAGYGKTSLLLDLIHSSDWKNCWLALDELDREPQRFAAYFIACIAQQFPEFGKQSNDILDSMLSFDQDMERLLVTLVNELIENTHEFFVIILDDFHLLENVQPIKNCINRFIQLMPENCHLIISSRKLTEFTELTLLISRGHASGLDFAELAFQPEELQALFAQNEGKHISDEEAKGLVAETEGWITGLQFSNNLLPSSGNQSNLFNYFKQQVLDRQPPELREFILRTALLDEFDAKLCEAVLAPLYLQKQDWQTLIKMIADNNVFALPVGENGRWLLYHHLFRDFIQEQFKLEYPNEVDPLLANLQLAYESLNEWEKAHQICKQLKNVTNLAELVERAGTTMIQHAHLTLESWLRDLPPAMLKTRPSLLSICGGLACLNGDFRESQNLLNQAEQKFRQVEDRPRLALTLSRRATTNRFLGEYETSLADANELIQLTEEDAEMRPLYAEALRIKGLALFRLGQARQAVHLLENSLQIYEQLNEMGNIPMLLMETGMAYRAIADFERAKSAYEKALQIWRSEGNVFQQTILLNNVGGFYHSLGQYEQSVLAFEEGLLCAKSSRYVRATALISIGLGDVYAELEDLDMAMQNYHYAEELIENMDDRFLRHALTLSRANLAFLQKDIPFAHQWIKQVKDSILSGGSNYEIGFLNLICGKLSLFEKKISQAIEELKHAENLFAENGRSVEADVSRVWGAAALHQNKKSDQARQLINTISTNHGKLFHPVLMATHQSRDWLIGLQNGSTSSRILRDLFSHTETITKQLSSIRRQVKLLAQVVPPSAPKLKIQAFGNAMVHVDGKPSIWQTQAVREVFFYFLKMHKPLTKEQIGELLWPDKYEPAKLNLRFKNELYRLRKAVGQNTILYENDLYRFNHDLDYEYDIEAFEALIEKAKSLQDIKQKIDLYQKAADLVQGPYLNDVYADWIIHERERLERMSSKALQELADLYYKDGRFENAIDICEKVMASDSGDEKAYQIAMLAHHHLKERAAVIRVYQRCQEAMKKLFGLPPSDETTELYQKLTK